MKKICCKDQYHNILLRSNDTKGYMSKNINSF